MTTWSSDDFASFRMGEAIKAACIAEGGWMDWSKDGKVRFLNRGERGDIGVYFSDWIIRGMRANKDKIKRYVELLREMEERRRSKYGVLADCLKRSGTPRVRFSRGD